jgi:hypothetical protein
MSSCRRSWYGGAARGTRAIAAPRFEIGASIPSAPPPDAQRADGGTGLHSSSHRSASSDCVGDVAIVPIRAVPPEGALSRSPKLMRAFRGNVTGDASACAHRQSWERWRRGSTRRRGGCASSCMRAQGDGQRQPTARPLPPAVSDESADLPPMLQAVLSRQVHTKRTGRADSETSQTSRARTKRRQWANATEWFRSLLPQASSQGATTSSWQSRSRNSPQQHSNARKHGNTAYAGKSCDS